MAYNAAMFRLHVDISIAQRMEQELLRGDAVFEAVEQLPPGQVVWEVLGSDAMESGHPLFEPLLVSADVLIIDSDIPLKDVSIYWHNYKK